MERTPTPRPITVAEYYDMARTGLLERDARVELIDGEVVHVPPIGSRHAGVAQHGIPEVWIVDLKHNQLLTYRSPSGERYIDMTSATEPDTVAVPGVPEVILNLSELLAEPS